MKIRCSWSQPWPLSVCLLCHFLGGLTANAPSTARVTPKQGSAAVTLPQPTATSTGSVNKQSEAAGQTVTTQSSHTKTTTQQVTTTSITTTQKGVRMSSKIPHQPNKTAQLGRNTTNTTLQSSRTGKKHGLCCDWFNSVLDSLIIYWIICAAGTFFSGRIWKRLQRREKADKCFHGKWVVICMG